MLVKFLCCSKRFDGGKGVHLETYKKNTTIFMTLNSNVFINANNHTSI